MCTELSCVICRGPKVSMLPPLMYMSQKGRTKNPFIDKQDNKTHSILDLQLDYQLR